MTDEEKKKKQEKTWFEEFLYYFAQECMRIAINQFFDEVIGWRVMETPEFDINEGVRDLDEIEEWQFW